MNKNIVVLPGDCPEVTTAAVTVLQAVGDFSFNERLIGGCAIDEFGDPLPSATLEACQQADAVLLGAVGGPKWESSDPDAPRPEQGLLGLRQGLNVHANLRPTRVYDSLAKISPFKNKRIKGTDFIIVRELLGGIYFGDKGQDETGTYDVCHYTDEQIKNVGRTAFELAIERSIESGRVPKLVSVDKANVLETSKRWRALMEELHLKEYPAVFFRNMLVDNAAQQLNINPWQFDVIVTENLFGDILTDQAATLNGSIGLSPSASLGLDGPGLFEPIHGSAPDIAGKNKVNPIGAILSGTMALKHLDMPQEAGIIESAVEKTLKGGFLGRSFRTEDIGGRATTQQVTRAVLRHL